MAARIFTRQRARSLLPQRQPADHKASAGRSLIVAGSTGMYGAAVLCATAASRVGSGYVTLMTETEGFPIHRHPDFLITPMASHTFRQHRSAAMAIGPGLGRRPRTRALLRALRRAQIERVVLDADALNVSAEKKCEPFPATWILTPHEGELSRLLGVSAAKIHARREFYLRRAQKKWGGIIVLKGHHTLVCSGQELFKITRGNAALAKAGTGDVLTGMICGFLAQGLAPTSAAALAVFVHASAADRWLRLGRDPLSLMASDVIQLLPETLREIRGARSSRRR